MKQNLQLVQTRLRKVNQITERRLALEAEQRELQTKIKTLTTEVAAGDEKEVNALTIAKSRSEVLPAEVASVQREFDDAIVALRNSLPALSLDVATAYKDEFQRMQTIAKEFLKTHLESAHLIEEYTRQITINAKTVLKLDYLNSRFSTLTPNQTSDPDAVISRARAAIANLADV
jgi:hypothetical protein